MNYSYHWETPSKALGEGWQPGKCALCREESPVRFCSLCNAVFCVNCTHKYFERGVAAVKALITDSYRGEILVRKQV